MRYCGDLFENVGRGRKKRGWKLFGFNTNRDRSFKYAAD